MNRTNKIRLVYYLVVPVQALIIPIWFVFAVIARVAKAICDCFEQAMDYLNDLPVISGVPVATINAYIKRKAQEKMDKENK